MGTLDDTPMRTDEYHQALCPVMECGAVLYLIWHTAQPVCDLLDVTYAPSDAYTSSWDIECENDHRLWSSADQARATGEDQAADNAEPLDLAILSDSVRMIGAADD